MAYMRLAERNNGTSPVAAKRVEAARVLKAIDEMCAQVGPEGRIPRHTELMRRLGASERIVLKALEELQRQGRIVRRHGAGTFVTEQMVRNSFAAPKLPQPSALRTIVAIARPDRSIFDRCMELLYEESVASDLIVSCHLIGPEQISSIDIDELGSPMGFIIFRRDLAPLARQLQDVGQRVVLVGAPGPQEMFGVPCVCGNQEQGGYLAVKHLHELGHRRIAVSNFGGDITQSARWQGYQRILRESQRCEAPIQYSTISRQTVAEWTDSAEAARRFFDRPDAPTAIAAWNDREAIAMHSALLRAKVTIPDQVSLIGYDNLEEGARVHPALTTVDHQIEQQVATAVGLLTGEGALDASRTFVFTPTILVRETTSAPNEVTNQVNLEEGYEGRGK